MEVAGQLGAQGGIQVTEHQQALNLPRNPLEVGNGTTVSRVSGLLGRKGTPCHQERCVPTSRSPGSE